MEMPSKMIFGILLLIMVLVIVLYGIIDQGIVQGLNSILDIAREWLSKLLPN
jgi:hypothetical protein